MASNVDNGRGAGSEPEDVAVLAAIDTIVVDEPDETSLRDLDVDTHPLPRIPRSVQGLWHLRIVVVAITALVVGGAWFVGGARAAVVVGLWPGLWVVLLGLVAYVVREGQSEDGMLRLERKAHPRFFALVDDICARVSTPPPDAFFLINESNSYNARVRRGSSVEEKAGPAALSPRRSLEGWVGKLPHQKDSSILLGFPAVIAYDVTALRSTIGHELGHHLSGDTRDGALLAWAELETFARIPAAVFPLRRLARRLADLARADSMRRSRLNEHAADFWGGVAAGQGTTAACLRQDRRASHLWQTLVDDMAVLREGGHRVDDIYRFLKRTRESADHDGFEMLPSVQRTDPLSTHPAEGARADIAEAQLQHLAPVVTDTGPAVGLFEAGEEIMADLTALYFDPRSRGDGDWLEVVDDDDLWDRYIAALRPQLRGAFIATGHPRLAEPMSALALFHEVRALVEGGARFIAERRDETLGGLLAPPDVIASGMDDIDELDVTFRLVGALLDVLVHDGLLTGSRDFGAVRSVTVDAVECFRLVLAARLARGERWDDITDEIDARLRWLAARASDAAHATAWVDAFHRRTAGPDLADCAFDDRTDDVAILADNSDREWDEGTLDDLIAPAAE